MINFHNRLDNPGERNLNCRFGIRKGIRKMPEKHTEGVFMNRKSISLACMLILVAAAACFGAENTAMPDAVAVEPVFEFKPVLDGDEVTHDYVIQNKGSAELVIERIQTG